MTDYWECQWPTSCKTSSCSMCTMLVCKNQERYTVDPPNSILFYTLNVIPPFYRGLYITHRVIAAFWPNWAEVMKFKEIIIDLLRTNGYRHKITYRHISYKTNVKWHWANVWCVFTTLRTWITTCEYWKTLEIVLTLHSIDEIRLFNINVLSVFTLEKKKNLLNNLHCFSPVTGLLWRIW